MNDHVESTIDHAAAAVEAMSEAHKPFSSASTKIQQQSASQLSRFKHRSLMRELFSIEYIKDFNATRAAIRAGYSAKTAAQQASRLLKSARVRDAIAEAKKKLQRKTGVSIERVIEELGIIGFASIGDFPYKDGWLHIRQVPSDARRGLGRLEVLEVCLCNPRKERVLGRYKLDFRDKLEALRVLAMALATPAGIQAAAASEPPSPVMVEQPPPAGKKRLRSSPMRDLFVTEYLKDFNATRAAERAGYSPRTSASQGSRLLKSPVVAKAVERARTKTLDRPSVPLERYLRQVAQVAFRDPIEFFDEKGGPRFANQIRRSRVCSRVSKARSGSSTTSRKIRHAWRISAISVPDKIKALRLLWTGETPLIDLSSFRTQTDLFGGSESEGKGRSPFEKAMDRMGLSKFRI